MEIQKVGELGEAITIECFGAALSGKGKGVDTKILALIRARDKAIIERTIKECQHILECDADTLADNGMGQKASGLRRGSCLLPEALDSILRDLD
jgi:hypothetical protein